MLYYNAEYFQMTCT